MQKRIINHPKPKGKKEYTIYTKEEADELGVKYKKWNECEVGEYGLTDDNVVLELISKKEYYSQKKYPSQYFTFPLGSVFFSEKYSKNHPFLIKKIAGHHLTSSKTRNDKWGQTDIGKRIVTMFAHIPNANLAIDTACGDHSHNEHMRWQKWMRTEVFHKMVREEITALLSEKGFSEAETIELLKETIDLCKSKRDTSNLMRAIENLLDMHGMKSKDKVKTTESIEGTQTRKLIDDINSEEKVYVKLERTTEKVNDEPMGRTERPATEEDCS